MLDQDANQNAIREAINRVAEPVRRSLKRYLSKRLSESDAEDMVQDCFKVVCNNVATGKIPKGILLQEDQLRAYLFGTLKKLRSERYRNRDQTSPVESSAEEVVGDAGVGYLKAEQQSAEDLLFEEVMEQLEDVERSVVEGWVKEESEKETAARLGVSLEAAKMRRMRARVKVIDLARSSKRFSRLEELIALFKERLNK